MYDYVIVGAGPSGLTLAFLLGKIGKSVLLIEKESSIGGCHRVTRVTNENLFTDHGPRVYSHSYVNFKHIMKQMGMSFSDFFVEYRSSFISKVSLNVKEITVLLYELSKYLVFPRYGIDKSMKSLCDTYSFSPEAHDYIDLTCRLSDGADYSRYTVYQFLGLIEYQGLYGLYQPKKPLDEELFPIWERNLTDLNVTIKKNCNVIRVNKGEVSTTCGKFICDKVILAIPLERIVEIPRFEALIPISKKTAYIKYVHIMFHWDTKIDLSKIDVFKNSKEGIQYIVQSKYTKFKESSSKTVLSSIITRPELVRNQNEVQVIKIVFDHLRSLDPELPIYTNAIVYPGNSQDADGYWNNKDTSFVLVPGIDYIDFKTVIPDVYILGPYNKYSPYPATTLESAVANSIKLFNKLENRSLFIRKAITLKDVILLIAFAALVYNYTKNSKPVGF